MLVSCCSCCHWNENLGKFISYKVLQVWKEGRVECRLIEPYLFSWNLSFVDIDSACNFTHCESQPRLLFDFMIPAGCLVILWWSREGGGGGGEKSSIVPTDYFLVCCLYIWFLIHAVMAENPPLIPKPHLTTTCNDVFFYLEARGDDDEHGSISYLHDSPWSSKFAAVKYLCLGNLAAFVHTCNSVSSTLTNRQ